MKEHRATCILHHKILYTHGIQSLRDYTIHSVNRITAQQERTISLINMENVIGTLRFCCQLCFSWQQDSSSNTEEFLTPEEREQRRQAQAQAAEKRAQNFQQGGGGERVKAAAARRDSAEKKAIAEGRGPNSRNNMQWQV